MLKNFKFSAFVIRLSTRQLPRQMPVKNSWIMKAEFYNYTTLY